MTGTLRRYRAAALVAAMIGVGVSGCVGGQESMVTPDEAQRAAVDLLHETEEQVDLAWPETPNPTAERCHGGVRFGYFVVVTERTNTQALAATFQRFWEAKGLVVSASERDFGTGHGILYSATADRRGSAGAAYQLSDTTVVIRITSPCAHGSPDGYEQ